MSWLKRTSSNLLIGFGVLFLLAAILSMQDDTIPRQERTDTVLGCLLLGIPSTAGGVWIARQLRQQKRQRAHDRLRSVLFQLLQQNNVVSVLQFAIAADISGTAAKAFLDEQAREFAANFDVNEQGDVLYRFTGLSQAPEMPMFNQQAVSLSPLPMPTSGMTETTYDVILETVPRDRAIAVIKAIRELTGLGLKETKTLVETAPQPVQQRVSLAIAEVCRQRLTQAGAIARIQQSQGR